MQVINATLLLAWCNYMSKGAVGRKIQLYTFKLFYKSSEDPAKGLREPKGIHPSAWHCLEEIILLHT